MMLPSKKAYAATQTPITRAQAEQRALDMIALKWTYTRSKNAVPVQKFGTAVKQPKQLSNVATTEMIGIPYDWGGLDALDSSSYKAPWISFTDAISKGAYAGNVNGKGGYGYIAGTAGIDCSGFIQAAFNIKGYKQSTTTLLDNYFTKINLSDIKHMDILDKSGDHVVIFDKWGTLNGIKGAFTYEATPAVYYGGIQGTKKYFISMNTINSGYIPARYKFLKELAPVSAPSSKNTVPPSKVPSTVSYPRPVDIGIFAKVSNVKNNTALRSTPSNKGSLLGTVPSGQLLYMIKYNAGWYQVNYNVKTGWIWGGTIAPIPKGKYVTTANLSKLDIRSNASQTAAVVGMLKKGNYAEVIDYSANGSWFKISVNGVKGWVPRQYIKYIY